MSATPTGPSNEDYSNDPAIVQSQFLADQATTPLRVCCYGSSSAKTPIPFLKEAWNLGYILAKRGHTCVNGAGSFGCMAAMNDGAHAGNGHIVGVIHEMFLVDGNDFYRDGGAHQIFDKREILIAGGKDLQERKRLLVDGADSLVVLPGGPGTWDELWEMACARNLGLTGLPIVCVSVNGYYDSFREMLVRAYDEGLVKNKPEDLVHFVPNVQEAVRWIEAQPPTDHTPKVKTRASLLKRASFLSPPLRLMKSVSWFSSSSDDDERIAAGWQEYKSWLALGTVTFAVGVSVGMLVPNKKRS